MRTLNIVSGIAVLLASLAFGHLLHHYFEYASPNDLHNPSFLAGMIAGTIIGILSFIGGCLLIRRAR